MKTKMKKKKTKNQQCFADDLQQTETNSNSNGDSIIESEKSVVPSSSAAAASCSPVSVLELGRTAPILNESDREANDSVVITTEDRNAELNRNEHHATTLGECSSFDTEIFELKTIRLKSLFC